MSKDNDTPSRVQVIWNMIGGDTVVNQLMAGTAKLRVERAGVVTEGEKGRRKIVIDTIEEARAVVQRYPLSSFHKIGCLVVILPGTEGTPVHNVYWREEAIPIVWELGIGGGERGPVPFCPIWYFFEDVVRAAVELRKVYDTSVVMPPQFEVLTDGQYGVLVNHSEWINLAADASQHISCELVDAQYPYYMIVKRN